jgi:hypothetical protein
MVLKNIQKIKEKLPGVKYIVLFYNNGLIFQSTFAPEVVNIPDLGRDLANLVNGFQDVVEESHFEAAPFQKLIYETAHVVVVIIALGEDSNLALFFEGGKRAEFHIESIRTYLEQIKDLVDTDQAEINDIKKRQEQSET